MQLDEEGVCCGKCPVAFQPNLGVNLKESRKGKSSLRAIMNLFMDILGEKKVVLSEIIYSSLGND